MQDFVMGTREGVFLTWWDKFLWNSLSRAWCPRCKERTRWKFVKHTIFHEEEPPMFVEYVCRKCALTTGIHPSCLTEAAVKKLGFKDFNDFFAKVIAREKEDEKKRQDEDIT